MAISRSSDELSRFALGVLDRTRSNTGVAVYAHADGSLGFLARADDIAVTRTRRHQLSFSVECRRCGVTVTTCTTREGARVRTPCACDHERTSGDLRRPPVDAETFAASVYAELTRDEHFVLYGVVRSFVRDYWGAVNGEPDPRSWARFFRASAPEWH